MTLVPTRKFWLRTILLLAALGSWLWLSNNVLHLHHYYDDTIGFIATQHALATQGLSDLQRIVWNGSEFSSLPINFAIVLLDRVGALNNQNLQLASVMVTFAAAMVGYSCLRLAGKSRSLAVLAILAVLVSTTAIELFTWAVVIQHIFTIFVVLCILNVVLRILRSDSSLAPSSGLYLLLSATIVMMLGARETAIPAILVLFGFTISRRNVSLWTRVSLAISLFVALGIAALNFKSQPKLQVMNAFADSFPLPNQQDQDLGLNTVVQVLVLVAILTIAQQAVLRGRWHRPNSMKQFSNDSGHSTGRIYLEGCSQIALVMSFVIFPAIGVAAVSSLPVIGRSLMEVNLESRWVIFESSQAQIVAGACALALIIFLSSWKWMTMLLSLYCLIFGYYLSGMMNNLPVWSQSEFPPNVTILIGRYGLYFAVLLVPITLNICATGIKWIAHRNASTWVRTRLPLAAAIVAYTATLIAGYATFQSVVHRANNIEQLTVASIVSSFNANATKEFLVCPGFLTDRYLSALAADVGPKSGLPTLSVLDTLPEYSDRQMNLGFEAPMGYISPQDAAIKVRSNTRCATIE